MKDWEISRTYVLPRILYARGGSDVSTNKLYKPNLRYFSLREECNDWKTWKRSDYFYPEIIPEPDYSDSGDEESDESSVDGGRHQHYFTDPRSAIERLRELTEVYVSNVDLKKTPSKKVAGSQARPKPKAGPQKTIEKEESRRPPSKAQQARRSPSPPSKTAPKSATKSTTRTQQAKRSPSPPSKTPPKGVSQSPSKTQQARRSPSPPSKTASKGAPPKSPPKSAKTSPRPKSPPAAKSAPKASPSKQMAKSPPSTPSKEVAAKPAAKGKTTPATAPKAKATSKEPGVSKLASPSGDSKDVVSKIPPSSPTRDKSPLRGDQSSDDEQFIKPKKPYSQQSTERLKLHQELKFSQRYGKPGPSKTELQLALERYTENKMKRELVAEEKTSLEKILELQAKKIEMQETTDQCPAWVERLQKPPPVEADPETEEFFRVHARVVSSNSLAHCFLPDDDRCIHSDSGSDS